MDLNQKYVSSKAFGRGCVIESADSYIKVNFEGIGIKQFVFPDAFEKYIMAENLEIQNQLESLIKDKKLIKEKELLAKKQHELQQKNSIKEKIIIKKKTYQKANIAFKCNFCNGGSDDNNIGFMSACNDSMINYNIVEARHSWCCSNGSYCMQYYNGEIDRNELDNICNTGEFVCYESQMLKNWRAFAGFNLKGENKGRPMKLNKVQVNSLAVLTTRNPYSEESDRFIFGVFLVDDAYEGDNKDEGYVTTTSKYKLKLSSYEATKMKFWNYYYNQNKPETISWGQGLHRYLSDEQAAQILKDIVDIKKGKPDGELAKEFFDKFCNINGIDKNMINNPYGGLFQTDIKRG